MIKKKLTERILCVGLSALMVAGMILSLPAKASAKNGSAGSKDLQVDYHTKTDIAKYIKSHPTDAAYKINYDVEPGISSPYSLGKVSDENLKGTLALFNTYRYIAGIPADVTLNSDYTELTQAAAVVMAANNKMSHYPTQPGDMSDEMYKKGYTGAGSSNIGWNYRSLGDALAYGWMSDDDDGNIGRVGHRRWVLNPSMKQTGFGYAGVYSAMYAFDGVFPDEETHKRVAWPAQNTPVGYFPYNDPWTLSMAEEVLSATVTLTCVNTGEKWVFSGEPDCKKKDNTGYFNINNDYYGQQGCIIFRPEGGVNVTKDYSYNVSVSCKLVEYGKITTQGNGWTSTTTGKVGEKEVTINYTVDFFDIDEYANKQDPSDLTDEQKAQIKAFVERCYLVFLGRAGEADGINDWTQKLINGEKTGADVARGFAMSAEFKNKNLKDDEFLKIMYSGFFDREPDEGGYNGWMNKLSEGYTKEYVVAGFANSTEFVNLCARYGINPGRLEVTEEKIVKENKDQQQKNDSTKLKVDSSNVDETQLSEYVERLYTKILKRPSDADGVEDWKNTIMAGKDSKGKEYDAATVASEGFFMSKEYANQNTDNKQFVADAYAAFFDRDPRGTDDEVNYNNWVTKLDNNEITRQQMIEQGFGHSKEFKNLLTKYGFVILE